MTRLCSPPLEIEIRLGPDGAPSRITRGALSGVLRPQARWLAEADWWSRPIAREYWKALLNTDLLVEIFHDLHQDAWFLERIYD